MRSTPEDSYIDLGHKLRTSLTQIIGYSALLQEEAGTDSSTGARLTTLREQSEIILERIGYWLAPTRTMNGRVEALRVEIAEPVIVIIRTIGCVLQGCKDSGLLDVLRMGRACAELLLFVQQESRAIQTSGA